MTLSYRARSVWLWLTVRVPDQLAFWIACRLPRRVALWAFIRVTAAWAQGPGEDYAPIYDNWTSRGPS